MLHIISENSGKNVAYYFGVACVYMQLLYYTFNVSDLVPYPLSCGFC